MDLTSIENDLELSNSVLSYDRFYPGRILGNTFTLWNISSKVQNISLNVELLDRSAEIVKRYFFNYFETYDLKKISKGFTRHLFVNPKEPEENLILRSEIKNPNTENWYLEDPETKSLVKKVSMYLQPGEMFTFIVVLKS